MIRILSSLLLILVLAFAAPLYAAPETRYSISLGGWPDDIIVKMKKVTPNITNKQLSLEELNNILKRLDENFNFNGLRLLKKPDTNVLDLVGEISPEIKVRFESLSDLTEAEALNRLGLTPNQMLDEENLRIAAGKLASFYKENGYRFADVSFQVLNESTLVKTVVFKINRKQKTILRRIIVEGLSNKKLNEQIDSFLLRKFRKETLTQENLNKIALELRGLLSRAGYYTINVPPPQIVFDANELNARVIYNLTEAPRYVIEVINTKAFTHDFLEDDILKLPTYYSKDGNIGSDLSEALKVHYLSRGYPHMSVIHYETKLNDRIILSLNIDEGPYTEIKDFKIIGQISRPEKFYRQKFFELSSAPVQERIFIKEDIEAAAKNLLIYLQNDGYVNAKLSRVFVNTDRDRPDIGLVVLQIEEGQQVKLNSIQIDGASEANQAAAYAALELKEGQGLSLAQLEQSVEKLNTYYQSNGHIEFDLLNAETDLIQYSDDNASADLKFKIKEGPQVVVDHIEVEGNTRTKTKMILLELDFEKGDILTPDKIDESVSRLQRTGYFNSVEITTLEKDSAASNRTVIVKVTERDPGLRVLGIGVTDENRGTLHGYAGIAYRNFWGRGVGTSLRAEANYNFARIRFLEQKYTMGFFWPYIFDSRVRFRTSATRSTTISDIRINKVTEANTAIFSLEQDFTSHVTAQISYAVNTFFDHGITPEDEALYGYPSESLVIGSIGPAIEFDYRDNIFNPSSGHYTRLAYELAPDSFGNNNVDDFYRVTGEGTLYIPVSDGGTVFAQSLRAGYIKVIDDRGEGVPFDKRGFTLGGRSTIRGFESAEFFPSNTAIGASYRLLTSSKYELVKSELRFPISVKYDLSGALFYDGGQVTIEGVDLMDKWRDALGFGIRYNTPVGPLSLEYGHKLDKKTGESDGAFHLSFGVF